MYAQIVVHDAVEEEHFIKEIRRFRLDFKMVVYGKYILKHK